MIAHSAQGTELYVFHIWPFCRAVEKPSMHACAVWMYVPHIWPLLPICQILPRLYGWLTPKPSGMRLCRIIFLEKNIAQGINWIEGKQIYDTHLFIIMPPWTTVGNSWETSHSTMRTMVSQVKSHRRLPHLHLLLLLHLDLILMPGPPENCSHSGGNFGDWEASVLEGKGGGQGGARGWGANTRQ